MVLPLKKSWLHVFAAQTTNDNSMGKRITSLDCMDSPSQHSRSELLASRDAFARQRGPSFQKPAVTRDMIFLSQLREHEPKHRGIACYNRNSELSFHFLQAIHWIEHGALKINRVDAVMVD